MDLLPNAANPQSAQSDTAPAAPPVIHRADYAPPVWLVPEVALDFALGLDATTVRAELSVQRNPAAAAGPLRLAGDGIAARMVLVDGAPSNAWQMDGADLVIDLPGDSHRIV